MLIRQALPGGGKIMLFVGNAKAQNAIDRERGIRDGLVGSNITIGGVMTDGTDRALAMSNAVDVLKHQPDVKGLVGLWGYNGPAIKTAVQDQQQVGKVKVVCFDSDPQTIAGIRSGVIYGTVVQQPYQFAVLSAKYLVRAAQGDKSWIPPSKCLYVPVKTVTKANVDSLAVGS
jgi:ribose transport system substrate-binding protein